MRPSFPIAGLIGLILGVAIAWPADAEDALDIQVDAPIFTVGDWHIVRDEEGTSRLTIEAVGADGMRSSEIKDSGSPSIRFYNSQLNLTKQEYESRTIHFSPGTLKYSFPLFVGKVWEGSVDIRSEGTDALLNLEFRRTYSCEVQCLESVEVPAGRFEAFKTICETRDSDDGSRDRMTYWYAPTAGISVLQILEEFVANEGWVHNYEQVLLDYSRAASTAFNVLPDGVESTCDLTISMNGGTSASPHD